LVSSLGERPGDGKWAASRVGLIVGRQNGKNAILEARELAGLFLFGERLLIHTAHQFKTAQEAFLRIKFLIENSDDFSSEVKRIVQSTQETTIELRSGQRLNFIARSKNGSGRGMSGDLVVLDEAYKLPNEVMAALQPTLSARPNPQLWFTSSAGYADSDQLARVRESGKQGSSTRLAFFEWSSADDALKGVWRNGHARPLTDTEWASVAQANPGLGIRITREAIEDELDTLDEADFKRERAGIWDDGSSTSIIDMDLWSDIADPESEPVSNLFYGVDVSPDRKWASLAVAGLRDDGIPHMDVGVHEEGTGWVVDRCVELNSRFSPAGFIVDSIGPAASLVDDLEAAGLPVKTTNSTELAQACAQLMDAVNGGDLRHRDQEVLNKALRNAEKRPLGDGAFAFGRNASDIDISPLVAATLALWASTHSASTHPINNVW
jgi:phage terminase large subunit-like protein